MTLFVSSNVKLARVSPIPTFLKIRGGSADCQSILLFTQILISMRLSLHYRPGTRRRDGEMDRQSMKRDS